MPPTIMPTGVSDAVCVVALAIERDVESWDCVSSRDEIVSVTVPGPDLCVSDALPSGVLDVVSVGLAEGSVPELVVIVVVICTVDEILVAPWPQSSWTHAVRGPDKIVLDKHCSIVNVSDVAVE